MTNITVTFSSLVNGSSVSIVLYSRFTCIYGEESGEGKSHFFSVLEEGLGNSGLAPSLKVDISNPEFGFTMAYGESDFEHAVMVTKRKNIILVDEASVALGKFQSLVNESQHIFICITRSLPFKMMYPLSGIYTVNRVQNGESYDFSIEGLKELSLVSIKSIWSKFDYIVTEASKNHSEHELLSLYFDNVIAANGRDRLQKVLLTLSRSKPNCKILVFADLGNIGPAYAILAKRCKNNPNIKFYNYLCFEQLLYSSDLVRDLNRNSDSINRFMCKSLENYYSKKLEVETYKTELEYRHGKPLKPGYKLPENFLKLYSSKVSKVLKQYIEKYRDK